MSARWLSLAALAAGIAAPAAWAAIDTQHIHAPWPKQRTQELEVGRHPVRWRHRASQAEGLLTGVRFTAPALAEDVWRRAADYKAIGPTMPGVTAVRIADVAAGRQTVEVDAKVLWKRFTLRFDVEQEPPRTMRFRLVSPPLGEFRGVGVFGPAPGDGSGTVVELSTWLKPRRRVPTNVLLAVERMALLHGTKAFLSQFDRPEPRAR